MAIINFTFDHDRDEYPVGAYCDIEPSMHDRDGDRLIYWRTYEGRCILEREQNGYHDSDFYMVVWDDEADAPKSIMFATTRGWSYPAMGSFVDATPEIVEKYEAHKAAARRRASIERRLRDRADLIDVARRCNLADYHEARRLRDAVGDAFDGVVALLKVKNFRSDFRRSLAEQVRAWLADPAPKYRSPLSPRQLSFIR